MISLTGLIGHESDSDIAERLHVLRHHQAVDYVYLNEDDLMRKRLRVTSEAGQEYGLSIPRDQSLVDGAVILLSDDGAVVVRAGAPRRLFLRATGVPAALRLGFTAGHLHWKSNFDGDVLEVSLEAASADYLARIQELLDGGDVDVVD